MYLGLKHLCDNDSLTQNNKQIILLPCALHKKGRELSKACSIELFNVLFRESQNYPASRVSFHLPI